MDGTNLYVVGRRGDKPNPDSYAGDAYLAKYNASGTQLWERIWDFGQQDEARGVGLDSGGNVYVAGMTWGTSGGGLLAKVSASNVVQWENTLNSAEALAVDGGGNSYAAIAAVVQAATSSGQETWRELVGDGVTGDVAVRALPSGVLRVISVGSNGENLDQGYFTVLSPE